MDDLHSHATVQIAVVRGIYRCHSTLAQFFSDFVLGSAEIGPIGDMPQAVQSRIWKECHRGFTPNNRRASLRNSASLPVIRRNRLKTWRRNSERANAR